MIVTYLVYAICFISGMITMLLIDKVASSRGREARVKAIAQLKKVGTLEYRFDELDQLTLKQIDLMDRLGVASGKNLEIINDKIQYIEQKKVDIFRSLLKDGLDPKISIVTADGSIEKMPLSAALEHLGYNETASTLSETPKKKSPVFTIVKDD